MTNPNIWRKRLEDCDIEASLDYVVRSCLEKKKLEVCQYKK